MIDKQVFAGSVQEMALLLGIDADDKWMKAMYNHISPYFTNEEFKMACHKIISGEELYGKMPTPKQFLKYAPIALKEDDVRTKKKTEFLNKVCDYLELGFVSSYDKEKFYKGMTELEGRTLQSAGGISELYQRVHNLDYPTNIATIRKELSSFYDDNYTTENVNTRIAISSSRGEMNSLGDLATKLLGSF